MSVCLFLLKCHFLANCPESYLNTLKLLLISPCILYYFMLNKDRLVVRCYIVRSFGEVIKLLFFAPNYT